MSEFKNEPIYILLDVGLKQPSLKQEIVMAIISYDRSITNSIGGKFTRLYGEKEIERLKEENGKLKKCVEYYAKTEIYNRPDRDRNGMSGMSARSNFEIDDGEWKIKNGKREHYCYGKFARQTLREIENENE